MCVCVWWGGSQFGEINFIWLKRMFNNLQWQKDNNNNKITKHIDFNVIFFPFFLSNNVLKAFFRGISILKSRDIQNQKHPCI